MLVVFIRTIILYLLVIVAMRMMGKRQIGELQPFEFVVTLMLSELAAVPMENIGRPLITGIIPIVTLLFLQISLSYLNLKSEKARGIICGTPTIVIENGRIVEKQLGKLQYSINDLLEQLRAKDCPNIADVEYAILETNGDLSVILKSHKRPVTPQDLNIPTKFEGIPISLILDGKVNKQNLKKINRSVKWLKDQLRSHGINDLSEVFFCNIDSEQNLNFQIKERKEKSK